MGDELLKKFSPEENREETKELSYTEVFEKSFPYYLAIGMTYDEYWHKDSSLVKYYRDAEKIKAERENTGYWLQGAYIYEALCSAFPLFNPMSKEHKAFPYPKKPYGMGMKTEKTKSKSELEKEKMLEIKARFEAVRKRNANLKSGEIKNG